MEKTHEDQMWGEHSRVCSGETRSYLVAVARVGVAEPLDVVEDEPGEGDDHEDDEGDGDEHHRRSAHILLQVASANGDVQGDHDVPLQQGHDLTTFRLWDHDGHNAACACRHTWNILDADWMIEGPHCPLKPLPTVNVATFPFSLWQLPVTELILA